MSFIETLKSNSKLLLVAGALAIGGLSFAAPANAHEYNGRVIDQHGIKKKVDHRARHGNHRHAHEHRNFRRHNKKRRVRNGGGLYIEFGNQRPRRKHARRICKPHRALDKAWSMGVNRPYIDRIGRGKIVVKGRSHGHRAKVVFKRHSRHCRVIKVRGLRRYH